ncbi:MAG: adaptor protein MecA [Clostridia bacterium]|nr:adaptor protein MecA [Clostridia bacterium]MDR3644025.1 adaptor protein MecA [Clostridia bacterium]
MNIEMLSPDKLKVVLTIYDLNRYELSYMSISSDDPATKRMVSDILTQARTSTGFHFKNSKLLIEVVPGKNNGCVLYLTKSPIARSPHRPVQEKPAAGMSHAYILSCGCLDDAIDAIGCFAQFPDIPLRRSALYSLDGHYHLLFSPMVPGLDRKRFYSLLTELSEYGSADTADPVREAVIEEHGRPISAERAIENFIRFFS